jgi:cell wall assembly regulator SMI1
MLVSGGAAAAHIVAALMERGVDPQSVLLAVSAADEVRFSFLLHDGERDESVMVRALRRSGP